MTKPVDTLRLRFDAFELDEPEARLTRNGVPIALPPKAFAVLCVLAREPARLVKRSPWETGQLLRFKFVHACALAGTHDPAQAALP
jgi:hypothetical protein